MILLPYIPGMLQPETHEWGEHHQAVEVDVSDSEDSYWELLSRSWNRGAALMVVEQDVVPPPEMPSGLLACSHGWCSCPYLVSGQLLISHGLGCVRYSSALQSAIPDALNLTTLAIFTNDPPKAWFALDYRLDHVLRKAGYIPHPHGRATHLHPVAA